MNARRSAALLTALGLLAGCSATVTCPEVAGEARAVTVLDHGRHTSLAIERDNDTAVVYSYGDRRWYADGDTAVTAGFSALLRPTPAVLRRREVPTARIADWAEHAHEVAVAAARADTLIGALDDLFRGGDPAGQFAAHPRPYTGRFNSNHMVAQWLEELGCETRGSLMFADWRVGG